MKRSSRSSSSWEAPVLGLLAITLALSSWALWRDLRASPRRAGEGVAVGTITYRRRQAERKYTGQVLWGSLAQHAPVYDLDAIRTASDSSATIVLDDKTVIELGEDSLLVLDLGGEAKKLDLAGGNLKVKRQGGSGAMKVATSAGDLAIEAGTVSLADRKTSVSIAVSEGKASFRKAAKKTAAAGASAPLAAQGAAADAPVELGTKEAVSVQVDGAVDEVQLEPVEPASGKELVALGERAKVDFAWVGPASFAGRLELSRVADFSRIVESKPVSGLAASLEVAPGAYYWRLRKAEPANASGKAAGKGKAVSRGSRLTVVASGAPRLLRPAPSAAIASVEGSPRLVDFAWSSSPKAEGYRVEVSSDPDFANKALSLPSSRASLSAEGLGRGRWYWRVVALFPSYGLEAASKAASFDIDVKARPRAAWRSGQSAAIAASAIAPRTGALSLSWDQTEGADSYRLQVAKDRDFREVVYAAEPRSNAASISAKLDEGRYYARILPVTAGKEGEASEPRVIEIAAPSPIALVEPAAGAAVAPKAGSIHFAWSDPNGSARYRLELASDPGFASIVGTATASAQRASIKIPEGISGRLAWRVSALDSKGSVALASETSSFSVSAALSPPKLLSPAEGEAIDAFRARSFSFAWRAAPGATEYRLSLYRTTGGAMTQIREWRTDETSIEVGSLDFLAVDAYAWKLVAIGKATGDAAGAERESPPATGYFRVVQSSQVAAPQLKLPKVIYVR
jgi:hypothetical protein